MDDKHALKIFSATKELKFSFHINWLKIGPPKELGPPNQYRSGEKGVAVWSNFHKVEFILQLHC